MKQYSTTLTTPASGLDEIAIHAQVRTSAVPTRSVTALIPRDALTDSADATYDLETQEHVTIRLQRVGLTHWSGKIGKPKRRRFEARFSIEGGGQLLDASTFSLELFKDMDKPLECGYVKIDTTAKLAPLERVKFIPSWGGDRPSDWYDDTLERVMALDKGNRSLKARASLFLSLDLATATAFMDRGNDRGSSRISNADDARTKLCDIGSDATGLQLVDPIMPLDIKEFDRVLQELTFYVAGLLDDMRRHAGPPSPETSKATNRAREIFETLTAWRFKKPRIQDVVFDEWSGRDLIADVVRFASGAYATDFEPDAGVLNAVPNGAMFAFIPTFAVRTYEAYKSDPTVSRDHWVWWSRASLAGLEAFRDVCDGEQGPRSFRRYLSPVPSSRTHAKRWDRGRIAQVVERHVDLPTSSFMRRLRGGLVETFGDLDGSSFTSMVETVFADR